MNREKRIIRTSIVGIIGNVLLVAAKATIGLIAGSISVILDAINNLTDSLSSTITIIGTKLAGKKPDKKHPYGHGRIEYVTSLIIAIIILTAGGSAIYTSITSLIEGSTADYSVTSLIVISIAILVKVFLGLFFRKEGKATNSDALKGSGTDALFDAILSGATLIGALVAYFWGVYIEGYLGIVIGLFILKSGIEILRGAISNLIGERTSPEIALGIKKIVNSFPEVKGAYDLIVNNYGPNKAIGSIHVELDDDLTAKEIHPLTRQIAEAVYKEFGVILTVGVYASNNKNPEVQEMRKYVYSLLKKYEFLQEIHGFYVDIAEKSLTFDIIISFKVDDMHAYYKTIFDDVASKFPDYKLYIVLDNDFAD